MDALHIVTEMYLYFAVKLPLYAYESVEDMRESMPYHRIRWSGIKTRLGRILN